jgi:DICT domain-containing protein/KaiC/GvpD/RAD55 family RecA-like ATPase
MQSGADVLESLGNGKRVLCVGPPMTGKREFLVDLVRGAAPLGREALVVSTDASASTLVERHPKAFAPRHAGIVDCTGTDPPDGDLVVETVASPADLTGVAVAVSKALGRMADRAGGLHHPLVGVDALSTLSLYADFDRLFRFLHSFGQQVTDRGGLFFATLDNDGLDGQSVTRLGSIVDGRIEFRNRTEYRLVGLGAAGERWIESTSGGTVEVEIGTDTPDVDGGDSPDPGSPATHDRSQPRRGPLAEFVERTLDGGPTLTLCNVDEERDTAPVESHFSRLNVSVRRASLDVDTPREVALLHDGGDLLAASRLPEVVSALETVDPESDPVAVLEEVPQNLFVAEGADRRRLVRASRTVERLAAGGEQGVLHAGFQELSNLVDDPETLSVYDRLDETDVEVHLYGVTDADLPDWDRVTAHGLPTPELADAWFVVYEDPDDADRGGALVVLEEEPGAYDGFWSYDPEIVASARSFLESTYLG